MVSPLDDIETTSADLGRVRELLRILGAGFTATPARWASEVGDAIERRRWTAEDAIAFEEAIRRHPATLSKLLDSEVGPDADEISHRDPPD